MIRCYLLVHSTLAASHQRMKAVLNSIPEIKHWRTDIGNCFYVVSEADASTLSKAIRGRTGSKGRFIIAEINENRNGWLTGESWYLIKNKTHKPKDNP